MVYGGGGVYGGVASVVVVCISVRIGRCMVVVYGGSGTGGVCMVVLHQWWWYVLQ